MRQFKIERGERRVNTLLPVTFTAIDVSGQSLKQEVKTVDVSPHGAHLTGIRGKLRQGAEVSLARSDKLEKFQIAWVGEKILPGLARSASRRPIPLRPFGMMSSKRRRNTKSARQAKNIRKNRKRRRTRPKMYVQSPQFGKSEGNGSGHGPSTSLLSSRSYVFADANTMQLGIFQR